MILNRPKRDSAYCWKIFTGGGYSIKKIIYNYCQQTTGATRVTKIALTVIALTYSATLEKGRKLLIMRAGKSKMLSLLGPYIFTFGNVNHSCRSSL